MTGQELEDIFSKVDAALTDWREKAVAGPRPFSERIQRIKNHLDFLEQQDVSRSEETVGLVQLLSEHLESIRNHARQSGNADQQIADLQAAVDAAKRRISELESDADESAKAHATATRENSELKARLAEHESSGANGKERLEQLETNLAEKLDALKEALQRAEQFEKSFAAQVDATQAAQRQVEKLQKKLQDVGDAEQTTGAKFAELETNLKNERDAAESLRKELSDQQSQVRALQSELQPVKAERDLSAADLSRIGKEVETLRAELSSAKGEAESLRAEKTEADKQRSAEQSRLTSIGKDFDKAKKDLEKASDEIGTLRLQADKAVEARKLLQAEKERAERLDEQLKAERGKGTKSALAEQLSQALKENEEAQQELMRLREQLSHARAEEPSPATKDDVEKDKPAKKARSKTPSNMVARDKDGKRRHMGDILVDAGTLTADQLEDALDEQKRTPQQHLGEILVEKRFASEEVVAQALACQCDVAFVKLEEMEIDVSAANLISRRLASQRSCIPISATAESVVVAMVNPLDLIAIEDVERATNRRVEPVVTTQMDIDAVMERTYGD